MNGHKDRKFNAEVLENDGKDEGIKSARTGPPGSTPEFLFEDCFRNETFHAIERKYYCSDRVSIRSVGQ